MITTLLDLPEEDDPPRHYRVEILKLGKHWITANDRLHWRAKAAHTKEWRDIAAWHARRLPQLKQALVVCELRFTDARRRDPANWSPTAKAVIDGFVDALVFPDDNHKHVIGPDMRLGPPARRGHLSALIVHIFPIMEVPG